MQTQPHRLLSRYGLAIAAIAVATAVRLGLNPILGHDHAFATISVAILATAWSCGLGPALLALLVGLLSANFFVLSPTDSARIDRAGALALYLAAGSACVAIGLVLSAVQGRLWRRFTERRNAERAQREWLLTALASIGDAVIVADDRGRVAMLNRAAEELTGWPAREAVGRPLGEVFHCEPEAARPTARLPVDAILDGTLTRSSDYTLLSVRGGATRPVEHTSTPIKDRAGQITGVVLVFRDVTERWKAEQALKEADRRKDEFLAVLAHELRNPLAPIATALNLMGLPGSGADFETELAMAGRQVRHMALLIDDLMDVSRISRGKIRLRKEVVDLGEVVGRVVETTRPLVDERRHGLTVRLPREPVLLEADPTRLEQVFANLLNNAVKYTDPGGRIWITAERSKDQVVVRVRDTGIGIDPGVLPNVFEIFVQGERRIDRAQGGLGIGLSLVKSLVEMHGGSVTAHSQGRGKGSEFVVRLPASTRVPAGGKPDASPPPTSLDVGLPRWRILVVDDNVDAADALRRLLTRLWSQEVRVAYDGPAALEVARSFRPEVVLLDIGLPSMDGYEVASRLRGQPESADSLLVAVTGWGQEDDRRRSLQAGFDRHLVKPVELEELKGLLMPPALIAE